MFVLVLQSQSPASISSFLSHSFMLSPFHSFPLSHWIIPRVSAALVSSPLLHHHPLRFLVIIYNNYELFPTQSFGLLPFFSFFSLVWSIFRRKKITIKKDFVVAASKRNEMLSLPSMHKFVLFINWCFLLDSLPILYRISAKVQITQYRYRNGVFRRLNDRTVSSGLCPLSTCIRK